MENVWCGIKTVSCLVRVYFFGKLWLLLWLIIIFLREAEFGGIFFGLTFYSFENIETSQDCALQLFGRQLSNITHNTNQQIMLTIGMDR